MKKYILFLAFTITTAIHGQWHNGVIYFEDGSTKSGLLSLGDEEVVLRKSKKSKEKTKFITSIIDRVDFVEKDEVLVTFLFMSAKSRASTKTLMVNLEFEGEVSLYRHYNYESGVNVSDGNRGNQYVGGGEVIEYYVGRDSENLTKIFPVGVLGNGSEKAIKDYFYKCPKLIELIEREAFERLVGNDPKIKKSQKFKQRLIEIVKYYNSNCGT